MDTIEKDVLAEKFPKIVEVLSKDGDELSKLNDNLVSRGVLSLEMLADLLHVSSNRHGDLARKLILLLVCSTHTDTFDIFLEILREFQHDELSDDLKSTRQLRRTQARDHPPTPTTSQKQCNCNQPSLSSSWKNYNHFFQKKNSLTDSSSYSWPSCSNCSGRIYYPDTTMSSEHWVTITRNDPVGTSFRTEQGASWETVLTPVPSDAIASDSEGSNPAERIYLTTDAMRSTVLRPAEMHTRYTGVTRRLRNSPLYSRMHRNAIKEELPLDLYAKTAPFCCRPLSTHLSKIYISMYDEDPPWMLSDRFHTDSDVLEKHNKKDNKFVVNFFKKYFFHNK